MQKLRSSSRAIIKDVVYEKVDNSRFKKHLEAIRHPSSISTHVPCDKQADNVAMKISRYKQVKKQSEFSISPVFVENMALVRKMEEIDKRKSKSMNPIKVPHVSQHLKFAEKVKKENKYIFDRIKGSRESTITRQDLKKQFSDLDKLRMHSRKIKETIKKGKRKRTTGFSRRLSPRKFILEHKVSEQILKPIR